MQHKIINVSIYTQMYKIMYSIQNINNRTATGVHAMPLKDSTSDGTNTFALYRTQYVNTYDARPEIALPEKKWISSRRDASQVIFNRRMHNISASLNPSGNLYSMTRVVPNDVSAAKARVRSSGSVVPRKKLFWEKERAQGNI